MLRAQPTPCSPARARVFSAITRLESVMRARPFMLLLFVGLVAGAIALRRPLVSVFGPALGAGEASAQDATYYCPMHPSYRSDHACDCPVCNMKLVPLEGASGE